MRDMKLMRSALRTLPVAMVSVIVFAGSLGAQNEECDTKASLTVSSVSGNPGDEVEVEIRGRSDCVVSGLSFAIGHNPEQVEFVSATAGPFLVTHAAGELFLLVSENNDQGFMSFLAIFDLRPPITVPAISVPEGTLLARLKYKVREDASQGTTVVLRNEDRFFGFPPVANSFTAPPGEPEIRPALESGSIRILGDSGVEHFSMSLEAPAAVQRQSALQAQLTGSASTAIAGFSAAVDYPTDLLALSSADFSGTVWENADFTAANDDGAGTILIAAVLDQDGSGAVAAGNDQLFLNLSFLSGSCTGTATIGFSSGIEDNLMVDDGLIGHDRDNGLELSGTTTTIEGAGFVRGNANGDPVAAMDPTASINITDGIFILRYLYLGGDVPPCLDAADANDDGRINLVDGIVIFRLLIGDPVVGSALPGPFSAIGEDPTDDALDCATPPESTGCP